MGKNYTQMKAVLRFIGMGIIAITLNIKNIHAEENCNVWQTPNTDPSAGKYLIELRTCDLTYGLSAYVQIKNSSDQRLALSYRIITKDDKYKDDDIVLEPGSTTRAGNCQACAKRYAGFKAWELRSVKVAETKAEASAPVQTPAKITDAPKPVEPAPVVKTSAAEATPASVNSTDQEADQKKNTPIQKDAEKKPAVFKTEDGTEIPYDQLPPEFRPRK